MVIMKDIFWTVLCIFILVNLFSSENKSTFGSGKYYYKYCSDWKHDAFSCPKGQFVSVMKKEYLVSVEQQKVILKDAIGVSSLRKCTVFDADNWSCEDERGSKYSILDGYYSYLSYDGSMEKALNKDDKLSGLPIEIDASGIEYYLSKLRNW